MLAVGFDHAVVSAITPALALGVALAPLLLAEVRRFVLGPALFLTAVGAAAAGLVLAGFSSVDHQISATVRTDSLALLFSGMAAIAVLLWARRHLSIHRVVLLFGLGSLADAALHGQGSWKFDFALPTILVALGLLGEKDRRLLSAVVVVALGFTAVLDEGRSLFAFCLAAGALTLWQLRRQPDDGAVGGRPWRQLLLLVAVPVAIYFVASSMLTSGVFGPVLQERSLRQIDTAGSLISGGRPEWSATRELVRITPMGYGVGVVPNWADLEAGRAGLSSINVDTGGYVTNYMFGGEFRMHSVAADLWVRYGLVGLALAALMTFAIVSNLVRLLAQRRAPTALILVGTLALWYLAFGPIFSNWLDVCVAVALLLRERSIDTPETSTLANLNAAAGPSAS